MAERKTVLLRLSPKMWEEISKWADEEFRSVNGQIEYLLHEALIKKRKMKNEPECSENDIKE
ncbi:MAG: Arc family DNA binding domain-containing protein [Clostridia bacterium]|nr:Arc family DNA binding domain-containing protein [Clostridia bacterium]